MAHVRIHANVTIMQVRLRGGGDREGGDYFNRAVQAKRGGRLCRPSQNVLSNQRRVRMGSKIKGALRKTTKGEWTHQQKRRRKKNHRRLQPGARGGKGRLKGSKRWSRSSAGWHKS